MATEPKKKTKREGSAAARPVVKPFRFGFLVHDVSRMRRTLFDEVMRERGVTRSQWSVLAALSRMGHDGMMQVDIARHMDVGKVTIGGLIDRLEASGFVERRLDAEDRRVRRVFITDKGFEVIQEMQKAGNKLNRSILAGVTADELRITEDTLARVKANIRALIQNS
ncbi:MarR family winged helix-turn-helix transcriptional regulator [Rhizorhapis suberifaciens]|uniref:DNA-binding MarR family transcriptional regulator n=1 Tax=Rhizorhapis suberifaciens TaxID=13656 RepID=A0A840HRC3_9SPHN|nr:MarR family transcriptional regulator [Rhizorhapis suberifaciens]MBB4640160.1 DNA-binding MarR family transcriptional regulator [Rhizorhapis suberifaciens]